MLKLRNGHLVQAVDELPDLFNANEVFLDIESRNSIAERLLLKKKNGEKLTDQDKKILQYGGFYPFGGDRICGLAVTVDNNPNAYYVPVRHIDTLIYKNLELEPVCNWLNKILSTCKRWVNHSVNFDAQFLAADNVFFDCELACTLTLSKIIDSDRLSHELKTISAEYLNYDIESTDRVANFLHAEFSAEHWHNYAKVPIDILGEYAMDDVLMNRQLYKYLMGKLGKDQYQLWETEKKLTSVLFDMEYQGMKVDKKECLVESFKSLHKMIEAADSISQLADREFTNSSKCIYDILVNQFGMPVLATIKEKKRGEYIDTGRPTFEKDALSLYEVHPLALENEKLLKVIKAIKIYRTESQFRSLYPESFLALADNETIYTTYNQTVRTGRMSAKRPNSQQQNERSKALIHPRIGYGFISCDYSQIEFRLIAHYIKDMNLINAYNEDATTDFHQWVADLMHVTRKVGKTLNFGMAYGAGKRAVVRNLVANPDIIKEISEQINSMDVKADEKNKMFLRLCGEHAEAAYDTYHLRIPGLRETSRRAARACKMRGFIFNAYGRRRHLPSNVSYKAFNSLIQSCAMDLIKERMVALSPRFNQKMRDWDIRIAANVHDELLFECPLTIIDNPEVKDYIVSMLESPSIEFRMPMMTDYGIGYKTWAEAAYD